MILTPENKSKEAFIEEIVQDINDIPVVYLKTLYALIHTFKENILIVEELEVKKKSVAIEDDFDWDGLVDEIHQNRRTNNESRNMRIKLEIEG